MSLHRGLMRQRAVHLVLLLVAVHLRLSAAQLTDKPLLLPGRPLPGGGGSVSAAVAGDAADERAGYFAIPGTQRRLFYWYFQVRQNVWVGAALHI